MSSERDRDGGLQSALDEMDYEEGVGSLGQDFSVAIPCQLRFTGDVEQNTEAFHHALLTNGYAFLDRDADRKADDGYPHYEGQVMLREKYERVKLLVFRGCVVRLYPSEGYIPTVDELDALVEALEYGFNAELEHYPMEVR